LAQRASGTGVWDWDMVTGTLTWSPEFLELFGLPPDAEASFDHWRAALHPEDREAAERRIGEAVEERVALRNVYRIVRPEDDERWIETFGETHYDESGTPLRMVGTCVDITERKRAEEKVAQSHDLLEKLARLVPGVVYQYRLYPDGRSAFPYASPGMNDIYEVTPDEVREDATAVFGRLHPDDYQRVSDTIQESARTLQTFYCEFRVVLPRQGLRWRWSQAHPERMEDGGTLWHGIISDITDRKRAEEEVLGQAEQLRRTVEGAVHAMSQVVETRDPYTAGHERRVSELGAAIATEMGMTGEELDGLRLAGLIHDIGKIAVPAEILAKPGRLSAVEFDLIKQHAQAGYDILQSIEFRRPVALMARQHHERLDGSGYPQGLTGEDILPEARILAVADVVEAMSSHRPYRAALGMEAALAEIRAQAGVKYDGDVAAACLRVVEEQGFHFSS
jgi:PAS domain S-box-containing protein/putative nucleotidyltransferase with HDIG domain